MLKHNSQTLIRLMERQRVISRLSLLVALSLIPQIHFVNQITQVLWDHGAAHLQLITFIVAVIFAVYAIYLEFAIRFQRRVLTHLEQHHKRKSRDMRRLFFEDVSSERFDMAEATDLTEKTKRKRGR
jgi:preprotein translocase subunit SecG